MELITDAEGQPGAAPRRPGVRSRRRAGDVRAIAPRGASGCCAPASCTATSRTSTCSSAPTGRSSSTFPSRSTRRTTPTRESSSSATSRTCTASSASSSPQARRLPVRRGDVGALPAERDHAGYAAHGSLPPVRAAREHARRARAHRRTRTTTSASAVNRSACAGGRPPVRRRPAGRDQDRLERPRLAVGPAAIPIPDPLRAPASGARSTGRRPRGMIHAGPPFWPRERGYARRSARSSGDATTSSLQAGGRLPFVDMLARELHLLIRSETSCPVCRSLPNTSTNSTLGSRKPLPSWT